MSQRPIESKQEQVHVASVLFAASPEWKTLFKKHTEGLQFAALYVPKFPEELGLPVLDWIKQDPTLFFDEPSDLNVDEPNWMCSGLKGDIDAVYLQMRDAAISAYPAKVVFHVFDGEDRLNVWKDFYRTFSDIIPPTVTLVLCDIARVQNHEASATQWEASDASELIESTCAYQGIPENPSELDRQHYHEETAAHLQVMRTVVWSRDFTSKDSELLGNALRQAKEAFLDLSQDARLAKLEEMDSNYHKEQNSKALSALRNITKVHSKVVQSLSADLSKEMARRLPADLIEIYQKTAKGLRWGIGITFSLFVGSSIGLSVGLVNAFLAAGVGATFMSVMTTTPALVAALVVAAMGLFLGVYFSAYRSCLLRSVKTEQQKLSVFQKQETAKKSDANVESEVESKSEVENKVFLME